MELICPATKNPFPKEEGDRTLRYMTSEFICQGFGFEQPDSWDMAFS
jgi:hypothetical protein